MGKVISAIKDKYGFTKGSLSFREKLTLALPGPASVIGPIIIHNTLMKFYTDIIGLDAKFYGWIYLIYSIWNAINDPLLGAYIDKMPFNKKRGKYVYLMKVTAPTMLVSIFFMLLSSPSWNDWLIFGVLLVELFIFDTAYTVYSVAYQSYFLLAAPDKEERVDVDIIRTFIGNVLGAMTTIIPTLLLVGGGNRKLVIPVFSVVILVNALMYFVALRTLKDKAAMYENAPAPEHKNIKDVWKEAKDIILTKPFLTYLIFYITARGAISYYFNPFLYFMDYVVGATEIMATLADVIPGLVMLLLLPYAGNLIKKYGSKKITLLSLIPAVIGFTSLMFITKGWQAIFSYILIVSSLNVIQTAGVVINGALIDYDEMRTGTRKTGLYGGLFSLLTTSLTSLQATIFSGILSRHGYDGTLSVQSADAVWGIRVGAGLVPIIMCAIGFIPMIFYPIGLELERKISDFNVSARNVNQSLPVVKKKITVKGNKLIDENGNEFIPHGINMVCKEKSRGYIGEYSEKDFEWLKEKGFNLIRLGIFWDAAEPGPGNIDDSYFDKVDEIIGRAKKAGIPVFLDMHQDLFSIDFEDGAPSWATITDGAEHVRTELWSESYLMSGAVMRAFDNFWDNTEAVDGIGIKTHFINLWRYIAKRYKNNEYVIGYDVLNEPFPGSDGGKVAMILGEALANVEGGAIENITDESALFDIISKIEPVTCEFELKKLMPFYNEIGEAIRKEDKDTILFIESNYFSNAGIPSHISVPVNTKGTEIENVLYAPHGYDILVDTDGYDVGGNERIDLIFSSLIGKAKSLNIPALIGEWGCYPNASEAQKDQARHILELLKNAGMGEVYFDYSHIHDGKIEEVLKR